MTHQELISAISKTAGVTKADAAAVMRAFAMHTTRQMRKGSSVSVAKFGKFEAPKSKKRAGRNPSTGRQITIQPRRQPKFRPSSVLKSDCN